MQGSIFPNIEKSYAFSPDYRTVSTAADIIADKFSSAADKNIAVEYTLNIPTEKFNDLDICTLLANALDNAIHGCEKACENKYIRISSFEQGDIFLIEFEKSFDGNASFTCGTGIDNMNILKFFVKKPKSFCSIYQNKCDCFAKEIDF